MSCPGNTPHTHSAAISDSPVIYLSWTSSLVKRTARFVQPRKILFAC